MAAVSTDAILSIEIIALTIASVAEAPIVTQVGVLILIGLMSTFAVYGNLHRPNTSHPIIKLAT
jgi:predicted DNA repair protein MutK